MSEENDDIYDENGHLKMTVMENMLKSINIKIGSKEKEKEDTNESEGSLLILSPEEADKYYTPKPSYKKIKYNEKKNHKYLQRQSQQYYQYPQHFQYSNYNIDQHQRYSKYQEYSQNPENYAKYIIDRRNFSEIFCEKKLEENKFIISCINIYSGKKYEEISELNIVNDQSSKIYGCKDFDDYHEKLILNFRTGFYTIKQNFDNNITIKSQINNKYIRFLLNMKD